MKEVAVTEQFSSLDEKVKNCQNQETFLECRTKQYLDSISKRCNCFPFNIKQGQMSEKVNFQVQDF